MSQSNIVQSIERAIRILEELADESEGLGVTELSKRLDLHKSTVHRILTTLLTFGYVEQDSRTERYRLGIKLLYLGGAILERLDLRKEAGSFLRELALDVKETTHLVIPEGHEVVYIDKYEGNQTIRMYSQIGRKSPMHATSVGKAILAFSPRKYIDEMLERGLEKYTEKTIIDEEKLKAHLADIRKSGYAVDDEEHEEGIRCVAAPIFGYNNNVLGAISISGPTVSVTKERVEGLAKKVVSCANNISLKMGSKFTL